MLICTCCHQPHPPAAKDKYGMPVCAACAHAALRLVPGLFGRMPEPEPRITWREPHLDARDVFKRQEAKG